MKSGRQKAVFAGLLMLATAVFMGVHEFTKPKIKTFSDLSTTHGQLASYSFQDGVRGRHFYQIQLTNYPSHFQIPADFIDSFSKDRFQADIKTGDSLWLSLSKEEIGKLTADEQIFVFSVRSTTTAYLDEQNTIRIYNGRFVLVMTAVFSLGGVACLVWRPA